eukprot:s576_g30.t1
MSPGDEIRVAIEYRNKSFAIKAHVRQVLDATSSTSVASDCNGDKMMVRTIVCAPDAVDAGPMDQWEMTADGTPYHYKTITTNYVDPRDMWGKYWPYRTTLIRKYPGEDRHWTVVEVSAKFMEKRSPSGMIDQFLPTIGFDFEADCETLTLLEMEPHTLLDLGLVVVNESGDVMFERDDNMIGGLREEPPMEQPKVERSKRFVPDVLPPMPDEIPQPAHEVEAGDATEAVPEFFPESV